MTKFPAGQNHLWFRTARPQKGYFTYSQELLFTSDQDNVRAHLIRQRVLRVFDFSVGIVAPGAGFEFSGFCGKLPPDLSSAGSEFYDQRGRCIIIFLGHSISSETVVPDTG